MVASTCLVSPMGHRAKRSAHASRARVSSRIGAKRADANGAACLPGSSPRHTLERDGCTDVTDAVVLRSFGFGRPIGSPSTPTARTRRRRCEGRSPDEGRSGATRAVLPRPVPVHRGHGEARDGSVPRPLHDAIVRARTGCRSASWASRRCFACTPRRSRTTGRSSRSPASSRARRPFDPARTPARARPLVLVPAGSCGSRISAHLERVECGAKARRVPAVAGGAIVRRLRQSASRQVVFGVS